MENQGKTPAQIEQEIKELNDKYTNAMSAISFNALQSKQTFLNSLESKDRLVGDYLNISILVLAVAATLLSAKASVIQTKTLFIFSLI